MTYTVAVRALCEFTAKAGDLDLRFTPSPSAQEGIAGHGVVTARRGPGYRTEVSLSGDYQALHVRGRADGYDPVGNQLEEIKTYRGDLSLMPGNHRCLHWAQVKVYGWLLCQQEQLSSIRLALVYFNIVDQKETVLSETFPAEELREFFEAQCGRFLAWAERELAHRGRRDQALSGMNFPHGSFRAGQRALAEAVYKSAAVSCCLMAQAPTGIGKTIGTLFPLLKAMPGQKLDRVFYLAAKTPGRRLALDAMALIAEHQPQGPLRVLELIARDKACEHPDKACHGESCPLAQGFYDRLPAAREAALDGRQLDQAAVRALALEHGICPYYLSQELARWADVIVGDYNYYFDGSAMLFGLTTLNQWRVGVLVDEAHNLVDRARGMYTAELDQAAFRSLRRSAPAPLKKPLDRISRQWNALNRAQESAYYAYDEIPAGLVGSLQTAVAAITDYLTESPAALDGPLQRFYFDAMHFCRMAGLVEEQGAEIARHFLFDLTRKPSPADRGSRVAPASVLCIRNLIPAAMLRPRFEGAHASVLFSATLSPRQFYQDLLGLPERTSWIEVESPFAARQLAVNIIDRVSTRFQDRQASLTPIAKLMAQQFADRPGNYMAFFSSFDYLEQVLDHFCNRYPAIPVVAQLRRMDESGRQTFLAHFRTSGQRIGFAVLGGAFAEGIDLPGDRLIGAFIATLGLPQVNPVNEQLKRRMDGLFGTGYDYAYVFPGMQKVVQAAGRVIRTGQDKGVVYLIDDRFARPEVQRLLPGWWDIQGSRSRMEADYDAACG